MLIISKKLVSSHFPESQSYYSTLAKLMMKEDLDLSADDDVHSWLDALNENELSSKISFVIKQHPLIK